MNGKNGLACITPVSEVAKKDKLVLRPLPGLPVIRDLVIDMSQFYRQYEKIQPVPASTINRRRRKNGCSRRKTARSSTDLYECILCACCSTACPSFWWNPEKFIGPAGLLQAYRFLADSRDTATAERLAELDDPFSVFPLPRHHELRQRVSEGAQPDSGDRQDPIDAAAAGHLISGSSPRPRIAAQTRRGASC